MASAWEADRENDVIAPKAFEKTIRAWRASGKRLPLLFEHSNTVVGAIDPASMRTDEIGLLVAGEVDRSEREGQQAWRSIKSGVAGFSIGFMAESEPRKGGGRLLTEIDLLEISVTSKPMHPATRALSWKSAERRYLVDGRLASYDEMLAELRRKSFAPRSVRVVEWAA